MSEVVKFPASTQDDPKELLRRVKTEAERLARQSAMERELWVAQRAEDIGVSVAVLRAAVAAEVRAREEQKAADKRAEKKRDTQRREEEKRARAAQQKAEREAEQEAERKRKAKAKAFGYLGRLPTAQHERALTKLAHDLSEDLAAIRTEFEEYIGVGRGDAASVEKTESWPQPVTTAKVLAELADKICSYAVLSDDQLTAALLWTAHAWLYDHGVPTHSPILAATSAEPDAGKSTLAAVLGRATPRFALNVEMTGPSLYRYVDATKPTLVIDEADDLFTRRNDLRHVVNAGWTRGAKIARQVNIGGAWVTAHFDPFTPKMIALLGRNLPSTTRSRCIELRMVPKRADEHVEAFSQLDDPEFAVLRSKFARWAADNAARLKDVRPTMPAGFTNRVAANWSLLLAIAELAGGAWSKRAWAAAERLTRTGRRPSLGVQLLEVFKQLFADGRKAITSAEVVQYLVADPTSVWIDYNHGGPITQRQVAHLLDAYGIDPVPLKPSGHRAFGRQGYRVTQFADAFARYTARDPISQSRR